MPQTSPTAQRTNISWFNSPLTSSTTTPKVIAGPTKILDKHVVHEDDIDPCHESDEEIE